MAGLVLLTSIALLPGCLSTSAQASGWSGVAVTANGFYLASSQGELVALNAASGTRAWEEQLEATTSGGFLGCGGSSTTTVYGTPALDGNLAYVAGYNGKVYKFDLTSRTSSSKYPDSDHVSAIIAAPIVADGSVYVATADGSVYALDAVSLDRTWSFKADDRVWSTPSLADGVLYFGSFDEKVYALDAASGDEKWSFATEGAVLATPVISDGMVYVASLDRHVYALNAESGELVWQYPVSGATDGPANWLWATPALCGGNLYVPGMDGQMYVLDAQNGSLVRTFDLGAPISSSPVTVGNLVVAANEEGQIFKLDNDSGLSTEIRMSTWRCVHP